MKYQLLILSTSLLLVIPSAKVNAETIKEATAPATSSASSSLSSEDKQIKQFKERLEQAIAPKYQKKAYSGKIKEFKENTFVLESFNLGEAPHTFRYDKSLMKIYKISGSTKKELKIADVKESSYVFVVGSEVDKTLEATSIYLDDRFILFSGKITEVNKDDYTLKVLSTTKEEYLLDIEVGTKQSMLNIKTLETEKIGFSKMKEGDTVHVVYLSDSEKKTKNGNKQVTATKILIIPQEYFLK